MFDLRVPVVVASVSLILPMGAPQAVAEDSGPVTCQRKGHVTITPGLTMTPHNFTSVEKGTFVSCSGPGADGLTAVLNANPSGNGSCAGITSEEPKLKIKWSDGQVSLGSEKAMTDPVPFLTGRGPITKGKFAGRSFVTKVTATPLNPERCFGSGVTDIDFTGTWNFE